MPAPTYMRPMHRGWSYTRYNTNRSGVEKTIVDNWERVNTIAESQYPVANYSFDDYALLELDGVYYITNAADQVWGIEASGTKKKILALLQPSDRSEAWREFQRQVALAGWDVPSPPKPNQHYDW